MSQVSVPPQVNTLPKAEQQVLNEHVILVTGAGQGIGKTAATYFAKHGATVILLGRSQFKLETTYDEIVGLNYPEPIIFPMDLEKATEADYQSMAEGIYQQLGRLDGILHNASHFDNLSPLDIQTMGQFERTMKINVIAPFALTKACMTLLQRAQRADVIFTHHSSAHQASAYWGALGVSKKALQHLVETWDEELSLNSNIRLHLITPGPVQSPQRKKSHPGELASSLPTAESLMPQYLTCFL